MKQKKKILFILMLVLVLGAMAKRGRRRLSMKTRQHSKYPGFRHIRGPRRLSDRIAIVGGGPSGVHMAYMLKRKGFRDITILEKRRRAGGKSLSINYRGAVHEMGTVYLSPDYESNIIALANKFIPGSLVHMPVSSVWLDSNVGAIPYQNYVIMEIFKHYNTTNKNLAFKSLVTDIQRYVKLHQSLFGNYTGELMPRPNATVRHTVRGTFMEFLKRNKLVGVLPILLPAHTMQGYGHIDEVAALYGLLWNTPKMMNGILRRIQGQKNDGFYLLRPGFQKLWQTIIKKENLHVEYDVDIHHVFRRRKGSWLCTKHIRECQYYHFVIWTPELGQSLGKFHPTYEEERDIFSRMAPVFFSTSLVDTLGVKRGKSPIEFMFSNALKKIEHSFWVQRDSYATLQGYKGLAYQNGSLPSGNDGKKLRTTVCYQYGKRRVSTTKLRRIMKASLRKMGATYVNVKRVFPWRYFPRFNPEDIKAGILWDIVDMQGKHGMWYIGSSVIFESVKSVVEYNKLLISKMQPPCN